MVTTQGTEFNGLNQAISSSCSMVCAASTSLELWLLLQDFCHTKAPPPAMCWQPSLQAQPSPGNLFNNKSLMPSPSFHSYLQCPKLTAMSNCGCPQLPSALLRQGQWLTAVTQSGMRPFIIGSMVL